MPGPPLGDYLVRGASVPDGAAAVTPSDTTLLNAGTVAIYVGTTGNVSVDMAGSGSAILFTAVPAGAIIPGRFLRVRSTSTTASTIVALFVNTRTA